MKRTAIWILSSCLVLVVSLVLVSPAPAKKPVLVKNSLGKMVEKPKYGGVFVGAWDRPISGWDDAFSYSPYAWATHSVNENLFVGNWAKGPTGSGETGFLMQGTLLMPHRAPALYESWEAPDSQTIIFHIRKGVHWHDKPPVNGRQMDANDVYFSFDRILNTPTARTGVAIKPHIRGVEATDKWTVVVKTVEGQLGYVFNQLTGGVFIVAPEAIKKYGGQKEWQNVIGTGPFMVAGHVPGSSVTLKRHPNYWGTDPLHPDNKLPYVDGVEWVIIQDASTRLAALRTHKIDWLQRVGWEDAQNFMKTNPELKWKKFLQAAHLGIIWMRLDKPELPFKDIRVRRALMMAINSKAIKDEYFGGNAEIMSCPVAPYPALMPSYTPLEEQSPVVQEMYGYNPEKAKKLLAEAGYPKGFKTEVIAQQGHVPLLSIIKAYWADIGVDVDLKVKEYGIWLSYRRKRNNPEMIMQVLSSVAPLYPLPQFRPSLSPGYVDDPKINEARAKMSANLVINEPKALEVLKEISPYILEQAYFIEPPSPYLWTMWTPWIKGYNGEWTVGMAAAHNFINWIWADQDLKKEMAGGR